jgi:hypothetical protein
MTMGVISKRRLAASGCSLCALFIGLGALAPRASAAVPADDRGLPLWEPAVWRDLPIELTLPDTDALAELLARVPIAAFQREDLRPAARTPFGRALLLRTRVTETEFAALEAAGYQPQRAVDVERALQTAIEAHWATQVERGGEDLRVGERGVYHTYAQLGQILLDTETAHPAIAKRGSIGTSVLGRELWTLTVSDNVNGAEEAEPEVRISANIHGNEKISMEMSLYLIDYLTANYGVAGHEDVTYLVDNYHLLFLPLHNPDGHVANTRTNTHGVDLNRNFPVPDGSIGEDGLWTEEPETQAMKTWALATHCVISQDGHSGATVVNYPWDYTYTLAPDNAALIQLAEEYSYYNTPMWNGDFYHGITNGAQWYVTKGSLQDWSYHVTGSCHVIVEFSDSYAPSAAQLDTYWGNNRESFMHWIKAARFGVGGRVTDAVTGAPLAATVTAIGNPKSVTTDPDLGDYYKLLDTGTYSLRFESPGYVTQTIAGVSTTWGTPTVLDVALVDETTDAPVLPALAARLEGNFPNPFNPTTTLRYRLAREGKVDLDILDARGRRVCSLLAAAPQSAGAHEVLWNGRDEGGQALPSGLYQARLRAGGVEDALKLLLLK